jgi:hypothetical protein
MSTTKATTTLPAEAYRAHDGISASDLKHIVPPRTPAHYRANVIERSVPRTETKAMLLGTLAHLAVLEPDKLESAFVVRPEGLDLRTKPGKEWLAQAGDKPALTQLEADAVFGMRDAVASHEVARELLRGTQAEVSMFALHPQTSLPIKGRIDALGASVIVDVKTCEDASPGAFSRQAAALLYDLSAAHYMALADLCDVPVDSFWWVAVEKSPPFAVAVYQPSEEVMARGMSLAESALVRVRECADCGDWPGYAPSSVLQFPAWALREEVA